jgi:hypothetical protein
MATAMNPAGHDGRRRGVRRRFGRRTLPQAVDDMHTSFVIERLCWHGLVMLNLVSVSQIPYFFSSSTASHADSV